MIRARAILDAGRPLADEDLWRDKRLTTAAHTLLGIGRCWPVSGQKVDNEANTPVQTVHADFPHTAYQWSVGSQHYADSRFLPGGLPA